MEPSARLPVFSSGEVLYLFDGGQLSFEVEAQIRLQPDELSSYAYVTSAEVAQRTIPRLARRIQAAMAAREEAAPIYLEHGQTPAA